MHRHVLLAVVALGMPLLAEEDQVEIRYAVEKAGRASLAVYDQQGRLVRTLLTGAVHAAGSHSVTWDGRDRYGAPLRTGTYTWKLLESTGLRSEFIAQIGQNPLPVWEKGVCNHDAPIAAAVDATGVYRIGTFDEGARFGVKTALDGRYLWTTDRDKVDPWCKFGAALTVTGDTLYELIHNGTLYHYDKHTGATRTAGDGTGLWHVRWEDGPAKVEGKEGERQRDYERQVGLDLSAAPDQPVDQEPRLAVSYRRHNAVRWFSARDGRRLAEAAVPEPVAVAMRRDGVALVISRGAVVAVSEDGTGPQVVIPATALRHPWRVCVSASGDILVAENSALAASGSTASTPHPARQPWTEAAPHHQVKRFAADGRLLASYGRPAGRQDGPYQPQDFRGITDIEADPTGGFIVTEGYNQPPRRSVHVDKDGNVVREWFGAQAYGVLACPEPDQPEYVWIHGNAERAAMLRCHVDYRTGAWRVVEVYQDSLARNRHWGSANGLFRITVRGDRLHFFSMNGSTPLNGLIYDRKARTMRVSHVSGKLAGGDFWNDLNDDGLVQDDEMARVGHQIGGSVVGQDLTLYTTPHPSEFKAGPVLKPVRFTAGGTPVYDPKAATTWPAWTEYGGTYRGWDVLPASDGGWYGCFSEALTSPEVSFENHGAWYYNSCSGIDRLVKWDREWKPVWSVGRHSPDHEKDPGSMAMGRGLVGVVNGCVVWGDASDAGIARPSVWTEDGLYVDELLRLPQGTLPKSLYGETNANEWPTGHLARDPASGAVYYYALSSAGGSPVYRISGWDNLRRSHGQVTLRRSPPASRQDGTGLTAAYFTTADATGEPRQTRTDPVVYFHWLKDRDALPDGIDRAQFSVRWSGQVEAPTSEVYRFSIEHMTPWVGEGWGTAGQPAWLRLTVDGTVLIDSAAGIGQPTTFGTAGSIRLRAGQRYAIDLACGYRGNAVAKLCWDTPSLDRRAIPKQYLHPTTTMPRHTPAFVAQRPAVLAAFDFEHLDGSLVWSRTGGEQVGRLTGDTRPGSGRHGQGLDFSAGGPFAPALFPLDEELRLPDGDYSVSFWFRTTASDLRLCEAKCYSSYNNRWSDHRIEVSQGRLRFALTGDEAIESKVAVNDGHWHHVTTTVGKPGQHLYLDGTLVGTGSLTRRRTSTDRLPLDLGPGPGRGDVAIDALIIHGQAIDAQTVRSLVDAAGKLP
jgi:hypothetical protein